MKLTGSTQYLKSESVNSGDTLEILDAGEKIPSEKYKYPDGTPKINYQFKIKVIRTGDERVMNFNATSRKQLAMAWGADTDKWVGKQATILKDLDRKLGKYCIYLEPVTDVNKEDVPF